MTCTEIRPQLMDYACQRLSAAEAGAVDTHLAGCAECRATLEQERAVGRVLTSIPVVTPRSDLWHAIHVRQAALAAPAAAASSRPRYVAFYRKPAWQAAGVAVSAGVAALVLMVGPARRAPEIASTPSAAPGIAQTLDQARQVARESDDPMHDVSSNVLIAISDDGKDMPL